MKEVILWLKSLFTKKQTKNETAARPPDPKGTPTIRP